MKRIFKIISISVAAAVVVLTGWFFLKKQPVYDNYDEIQLFKVKRENLDNSIYISAIVVSDESEYVYSYVDAPVADVKVTRVILSKKVMSSVYLIVLSFRQNMIITRLFLITLRTLITYTLIHSMRILL